ncbi:NEDD4-binding protein 2-like [Brevipalpus obovatus]|uniref:NEDD4-binding protein 2-like n=1 Tax=Brevipalpus obovatus TaxID=246614 RepID=UPI003D9DF4DB
MDSTASADSGAEPCKNVLLPGPVKSTSGGRKLFGFLQNDASNAFNWQIPPFPGEQEDTKCDHPVDNRPPTITLTSRPTQVEDEDWVMLEMKQIGDTIVDLKSNHSISGNDGSENTSLKDQTNHEKCDNNEVIVLEAISKARSNFDQRIDRGTSTDDLPGDMNYHEKVTRLKMRFPRADISHIEEVLNACHFDLQWATNLLDQFNEEHFDSKINLIPGEFCNNSDDNSESANSSSKKANCNHNDDKQQSKHYSIYIDPASAITLQQTFGQILAGNNLDEEYLRVDIPPSVAQLIHGLWLKTFEKISAAKKSNSSKISNRQKDDTSPAKSQTTRAQQVQRSQAKPLPLNQLQISYQPKSKFEEIMDLEKALEMSMQEFNQEKCRSTNGLVSSILEKNKIATRMKREELRGIFPCIDQEQLEQIFSAHNYNLEATIETINSSYGIRESLPDPLKECKFEDDDYSDVHRPSGKRAYQSLGENMESLRWKMFDCKERRHEILEKARICYQSKKYAVASFYTKQAQDCKDELAILKEQLIDYVVTTSPYETLDLHGIHSDEVIPTLDSYISCKEEELKYRNIDKLNLNIITGRGAHSSIGPKLKPMVVKYLTKKKYHFKIPNPGMIRVTLR